MRYQFDDLIVDVTKQTVERDGQRLPVSGLNFEFLAFMLSQGNDVLSFDALIAAVWAPRVVNEETVTQRVRLLRSALGDVGRQSRYIRSIRGRGYQLIPTPKTLPPDGFDEHEVAVGRAPGSRSNRALLGAFALAVGLGLMALLWFFRGAESSSISAPVDTESKLLERADFYLDIGQQSNNDLAIDLYQQVLEQSPDNRRAMLGLSIAYSARVCRFGGDREWASQALELANQVIGEEPGSHRAHSASAYANDCLGNIDSAIEGYRRAIALSPATHTGSRSSLAYLLAEKGQLAEALELNLAVRKADPGQTFNDLQVARVYELLGHAPLAEVLYERSFRLYPDNVFSNVAYPNHLFLQGRFSEAREVLAEALQRPSHASIHALHAKLAAVQQDMPTAIAALERAVQAQPTYPFYQTLQQRLKSNPDLVWVARRLKALEQGPIAGHGNWGAAVERALLLDIGGAGESAIDALHLAVDRGLRDREYLMVAPWFESLRREAAFADVIDRISQAVKIERDKVPPASLQAANI
ncbi:MAG: hypothetical protein DHS20C11_30100 [Lysobacteraceae bacterium]|nr:MAG: hypothetical protein DHS20C11_30100 [Xanthomonadaceae bacterium]